MADLTHFIFYFVARIKLVIPLERGYKSNLSFLFYSFDIINNKKVMIKRILYFNIWSSQDGCFLFLLSALAYAARHSVLPLYLSLALCIRPTTYYLRPLYCIFSSWSDTKNTITSSDSL